MILVETKYFNKWHIEIFSNEQGNFSSVAVYPDGTRKLINTSTNLEESRENALRFSSQIGLLNG